MARVETRPVGLTNKVRPVETGTRPQGHGIEGGVRVVPGPLREHPDPRCTADSKNGGQCKARPVHGTELCIGHTRNASA